jgi:hypothetical protein
MRTIRSKDFTTKKAREAIDIASMKGVTAGPANLTNGTAKTAKRFSPS